MAAGLTLVALPIPLMIGYAPSWGWVVAATVLLGVTQGLTWSMTQTAQLDITRRHLKRTECCIHLGAAQVDGRHVQCGRWLRPTLINAVIDETAGTESGRITNLNPSAKKK